MDAAGFTGTGEGPVQLHCLGVEFASVPSEVRDALALSPDAVAEALVTIGSVLPGAEAVVLATCNRTELYVVEAGDPVRLDVWHRTVGHRLDGLDCPAGAGTRFHLSGSEAARHLFRVVSGLSSADLGDHEIAGQVRRARDTAAAAGTVGTVLHRLFDVAAGVSRRARTDTDISAGGAGVGRATAATVAASGLEQPAVTVIGAGDAANSVCRELSKRLQASITVVNRTEARAVELARRYDGRGAGWDELVRSLVTADVVVTAVHADGPVIDAEIVAGVRELAPTWAPLVVDACIPPAVVGTDLDVVHLDDLADRESAVSARRLAAVPAVEEIVDTAVGEFGAWLRGRAMSELITALYREADQVTADAAGLVDDDAVARQIHRAVRRLVHEHVTRLRALDTEVDARPGKEHQR